VIISSLISLCLKLFFQFDHRLPMLFFETGLVEGSFCVQFRALSVSLGLQLSLILSQLSIMLGLPINKVVSGLVTRVSGLVTSPEETWAVYWTFWRLLLFDQIESLISMKKDLCSKWKKSPNQMKNWPDF